MLSSISRLYSPIKRYIPTLIHSRLITVPPSSQSQQPKERQKIILNDDDLIETFVKGSGPGGQCINKRSSCVDLRHIPTGIRVQCQQTRSLEQNRGIARKLLREKLDDLVNGQLSKNAKKASKIAKQKARKARRAKQKYGSKEDNTNNDNIASDYPLKE
ncbi:RF-1 domain-containing protein [Cunninghamella echinulata]|nr:RF-1 domain-containing protein [Cunninghamella echinulata]